MSITLDSVKDKMLGKQFGKLTVLSFVGRREDGRHIWQCRCECGETVIARTDGITNPKAACRECKRKAGPGALKARTFLLGRVFGRLTVVEHAGFDKYHFSLWKCKCDCGNEKITRSAHLITGAALSCGCYQRDKAGQNSITHGLHKHPLYLVWSVMKDRCFNERNPSYYRYGGRGITVCSEWVSDFVSFYNWATSHGYQAGLTIERKDNDGNYEPDNCTWATRTEQNQNKCNTKLTPEKVKEIFLSNKSQEVLAKEYGVNESTINRIHHRKIWRNITSDLKRPR